MMSKTRKTPLLTALALIMAALLIFSQAGVAQALLVAPSTSEETELSESVQYVYDSLAEWRDRLIVTEYAIGETHVIQGYLIVDSIEDPGMDMPAFSAAIFGMLDELKLPHDRMYLDLVTMAGERLESYDLVAADQDIDTATFERFRGDAPDPIDPEPGTGDAKEIKLGEVVTLEDAEFVIKEYQEESDEDGTYIKLWFDFTNNSDETDSAFMMLDFYAQQGDTELKRHYSLDDDFLTTYADLEPGETMEDCTIAFYLANETDAVDFRVEKFLGTEAGEFTLEIGGVG